MKPNSRNEIGEQTLVLQITCAPHIAASFASFHFVNTQHLEWYAGDVRTTTRQYHLRKFAKKKQYNIYIYRTVSFVSFKAL